MVHKIAIAAGRANAARLDGVVVGVLGLTFKAGTDDLRESPSLQVIEMLRERGATVQAYDPTTTGPLNAAQKARLAGVQVWPLAVDVARGAHVLVVLTEWPEFTELDAEKVADLMTGAAIVDCRNLLDGERFRSAGLRYEGVGLP